MWQLIFNRIYFLVFTAFIVGLVFFPSVGFAEQYLGQVTRENQNFIYNYIVLPVFGGLAGICGWLFDVAINTFIIQFGTIYLDSSVGAVIDGLWSTVRDIFNLTFIFGLVYIGFQIILGINDSQAKRTIGFLILAALLVNFSLFITKFVVDFSNIAAVQVYNLFEQVDATGSTEDTITNGVSISRAFVNSLEITKIFDTTPGAVAEYLFIFSAFIIFIVLAYVFIAGAVLVTIRFAALCLYMVFSPVMFIGWVFPNMAKYSTDYWRKFLSQAFFAPAFLFMLYLSYRVTSTFNDSSVRSPGGLLMQQANGGGGDITGVMAGTTAAYVPVFAFFILTIVFLVASMIVAKNMGVVGASTAINIGNNLRKGAQGYAYSYTGGALSKGAMNIMDRSGMSNNAIGRGVRNTFKKGYDYGAGGSSLSKIRSDRDATKADITKNRSRMQGIADTKAGIKKVELAEQNEAELTSLRGRDYNTLSTDEKNRLLELETNQAAADKFITGLSKTEIEELNPQQREKYANRFSSEQVSKIMESDKINSTEKNTVYGKRVDTIKNKIGGSTPVPANTFKLTRDEIETLGFEWVAQNGHLLTITQFDDYIKNSKKVTPEVVETLKSRRKNELLSQLQTPAGGSLSAGAVQVLNELKKKPKDFAQLPTEIFTTFKATATSSNYDKMIPFLTVGTLEEIAKENKLDQAQRFDMKAYLSRPGRATPPEIIAYFGSEEGKKKYGP